MKKNNIVQYMPYSSLQYKFLNDLANTVTKLEM